MKEDGRGISEVFPKSLVFIFLALPWLWRREPSFILGVWHDAKFIADQIAIQRDYQEYYSSIVSENRCV